ncbi:MAG TPA: hypothetical protein VMW35_03565 [Myxococcota bacterium]|jgi:hypothetical protein|nr:hypothetical protein [Myxococcota bacterium]
MQVQIRSRGIPLTAGSHARIERQVRLAFGRLGGDGGPVSRVRLAVADAKGDVEPGDLAVSVLVSTGAFAVIQIDERAASLERGVERALGRAVRAMERRLS